MIWRPDMLGSIAFIVASWLAWIEVCHGWFAWRPRDVSWWIVVGEPRRVDRVPDLGVRRVRRSAERARSRTYRVANLGTFVGAVGFFVGAVLLVPEMRSAAAE